MEFESVNLFSITDGPYGCASVAASKFDHNGQGRTAAFVHRCPFERLSDYLRPIARRIVRSPTVRPSATLHSAASVLFIFTPDPPG